MQWTCRRGGDVVMRHNRLRDVIVNFCHSAHLGVKVEVGSRLTPALRQARPTDVLVADWERGRPAAWDVTVASPLTPAVLNEAAGMTAAAASEQRKHSANDPKCQELGLGVCSSGCRDIWQLGQKSTHHFYPSGHSACHLCFYAEK